MPTFKITVCLLNRNIFLTNYTFNDSVNVLWMMIVERAEIINSENEFYTSITDWKTALCWPVCLDIAIVLFRFLKMRPEHCVNAI